MVYFSIVFYVDKNHDYMNIKKNKSTLNVYYKNIINCFNTIKLNNNNSEYKFVLFTNVTVDKQFNDIINKLNIEVVGAKNEHIPPKGYSSSWQGTFYYLDAINYFSRNLKNNDILIVIDPDCIFTYKADELIKSIDNHKVINYLLEYEEEYKYNGLSRVELKKILTEEANIDITPQFLGGELYAFRGDILKILYTELEEAWKVSLKRFNEGKEYFHTEEHIFTFVFYKLGLTIGIGNKFIKRMWTSPHYRNIENGDENYLIWHLPYEKGRAIIRIYNKLININNISEINYQLFIRRATQIPKRSILRFTTDFCIKNIKKLLISVGLK